MALQIYQLVFPTVVAAVDPERFFRQLASDLVITAGVPTIDLNDVDEPFSNDLGASPVTVPSVTPNGYYNLYVNGIMQEGGSFSVTGNVITFNAAITTTFEADTILVLEAVAVNTTQ